VTGRPGAHGASPHEGVAGPRGEVWSRSPETGPARRTYYDRPLLKEPVWIWTVPAYLYVGGAAGAAVVLGEVADAIAGEGAAGLVRSARRIGAAGGGIGTALLIADLGRPERFLNMLRVLRPSSPMSVGSWLLAGAAPVFALSALLPRDGGPFALVGRLAGRAGAAMGLPLASYTAALLSTTAIPVWSSARRSLPYLFVSSAASSAAALLSFTRLNEREARIVDRFGLLAEAAEFVAGYAVERATGRETAVGAPLRRGFSGALWRASKALNVAGLALSALPGTGRATRVAGGLVGTAGGLATRFALFHAGKASARDPRATSPASSAPAAG
jgi:formate-dependent nitrite reductase membrane component NrfD